MGGRGKRISVEFEASMVYKVSSRTARTVTQRNPVSKNQNKKRNKQTNKDLIELAEECFYYQLKLCNLIAN